MNTANDRVNIASYVQVLQTLGRFHLLPHLQFLYTERNEPQLLFFGSPCLRTFRADRCLTRSANAEHDHMQSFLDLLPHTSPKTLALCIRFSLRKKCLHAVRRMSELQFLIMNTGIVDSRLSLDADFLMNFASRQTLIEWSLGGNISVAPLPASGFSIQFDSLTYLSFMSKNDISIAEYTPLLVAGNFPSLVRMDVCLTVDHTPGQSLSPTKMWRNFFKHLRSATTNSLSMIEVKITGTTACQVSFEDLPDLQLFRLHFFQTNLFHSLAAANLCTMSTYWPDLTTLCISGVDEVTIDVLSLVEIANLFPSLESLQMEINCKTFPSVDDVPVLQHDLENLKLSPLHLEHHIALARCIDRIFPKIVLLNIYGSEQFLKSGTGKEIQEMYKGLQSARRDQRKRDNIFMPSTFHRARHATCTHIYHVSD
jgi:hypothetical protein